MCHDGSAAFSFPFYPATGAIPSFEQRVFSCGRMGFSCMVQFAARNLCSGS